MKQLIILFALYLSPFLVSAQSHSECKKVNFETAKNLKDAEPCVLRCAESILDAPMINTSEDSEKEMHNILEWMERTPTYMFNINAQVIKLFKNENLLLINIYMACMAKAALTKGQDFEETALEYLVDYVKNSKNMVTQDKKIKKFLSDYSKGNISKYITL